LTALSHLIVQDLWWCDAENSQEMVTPSVDRGFAGVPP
jgi:hypothetical protein